MPDNPTTQHWNDCQIGSCQRHRECMYKPCRAPKVTASALQSWCITLRFDDTEEGARAALEKALDLVRGFGSVGSLKLEDQADA